MENFNFDTILASLREGQNADSIAKAMSDALNSANKAYEAEKKAKEAAEKKLAEDKAAREAAKIEILDEILDDFHDWYAEYYSGYTSPLESVTAEDFIDLIDSSREFASNFFSLLDIKNENADKILNSFLREFGL